MKRNANRLFFVFIILAGLMLSGTGCDKDKPTKPTMDFGVVAGTVMAPGRAVLPGVTVAVGNLSTVSDHNGQFILSGLAPGQNVKVNFSKDGLISTQKVVKIEKGRTTFVSATLFTAYAATFSAGEPFSVDYGANLSIPAAAFVGPGGAAFNGVVRVEMRYYDPTNPECLNAFPGTFSGVQTDGSTTMFESYGFINASFMDATNPELKLQLAAGKQVQITAPIPYSLEAGAPETMPMWYYDDATGVWREEGVATKVGNSYQGSVSHFSYWNFDHPIQPTDQSTLTGKVMTADRGTPVIGAQVVATGVGYAGYTTAYTNAHGVFSITVKASATVKLQAFSGSNASFQSPSISTPASNGSLEVADLIIEDRSFIIMGKLVDNNGNPLQGYGQVTQLNPPSGDMGFSAWLTIAEDGTFSTTAQHFSNTTTINVMFSIHTRSSLYSASIPFAIPQAGNVWDFGNVTMRPGGNLTGRAKTADGTWLANAWLSFSMEGATGEGNYYSAETDDNGNFTVSGPPNTTLRNMRAHSWMDGSNYSSALMTLNFPASGASRNLGTITLNPE